MSDKDKSFGDILTLDTLEIAIIFNLLEIYVCGENAVWSHHKAIPSLLAVAHSCLEL